MLMIVSLARLSHGTKRECGLLPYTDPCLTPLEFLGALIGSDDVSGRDVQIRCGRTAGPANENKYYTSVPGRHVRKHRQNQLTPQEILGLLGTDQSLTSETTLMIPYVTLSVHCESSFRQQVKCIK